ncbi:protein kinase domain-containing protein [Citrus sinensis]|nr:protein kinase domain-containing protein [Citrus sinensis]
MKRLEEDAFACGIEKLTSGAGACSNYSVADVSKMLGNKLIKFNEDCKFVSSDGEWDQICGVCVQSWEEIKGPHFASSKAESIDIESEVCRFAAMVSLISSRIGDEKYAQNVFTCLAAQDIYITKQTLAEMKMTHKTAFKGVRLKDPGCPRYTIREVHYATEKLNELNLIGEGITGKVYKGKLSNNQHVAIKHITNEGNVETFVREVASSSHVRHPNLVALLGYCLRVDECFLIYELCPNGNLAEWLFGKDKCLSWIQRLEIAIDSARGLWFLHSYSEGCIVHRDIKPTNILLGPNFEAKLSDFGLSKVIDIGETYASSEVRGTFGYLDPEYRSNCKVNSSGDVYSFGIVLLQILSGKKVINMNLKKPMHLNKMAKVLTRAGSALELADPKLDREYSIEAFDLTLQLALSCTALTHQRPPMEQVFVTLQKALDISTTAKASTTQTSTTQPSTP